MSTISALVVRAEALLSGEPARFIGYGAAIVIWLVVALANHFGLTQFGSNIDLPTALGLATAAIAVIVTGIETIRHFVYSPATVTQILAEQATPAPAEVATPVPAGSEPMP